MSVIQHNLPNVPVKIVAAPDKAVKRARLWRCLVALGESYEGVIVRRECVVHAHIELSASKPLGIWRKKFRESALGVPKFGSGMSLRMASAVGLIWEVGIFASGNGVLMTVPFGPIRRDSGS